MARNFKPMDQAPPLPTAPEPEQKKDEEIKVIPTDQYIFETLKYHTALLENINLGLARIAKQAGFDLAKE